MSENEKPSLGLIPGQPSLDDLAAMFKHLTGRDPTPEEIEEVRQRRAARAAAANTGTGQPQTQGN